MKQSTWTGEKRPNRPPTASGYGAFNLPPAISDLIRSVALANAALGLPWFMRFNMSD